MAKKRGKKKYPQTRELPYRMPPLGWKDHLLYSFLMLFFVALAIAVFPLRGWITHTFFPFEGEYIAAWGRGGASLVFFPMLFVIFLGMCMLIPWLRRYPVFGRKDVEYGPPRYEPIHPLLARDKPAYRRTVTKKEKAENKKIRRILIACLVGIILFDASMFLLSLGGGTVLHPDGSIDTYGVFNRERRSYTAEDVVEVELHASGDYEPYGQWGMVYVFKMSDGREYSCGWYSVTGKRKDVPQMLDTAQEIKELFLPAFSVRDSWPVYFLDRLAAKFYMTPEEEALLYELFDRVP